MSQDLVAVVNAESDNSDSSITENSLPILLLFGTRKISGADHNINCILILRVRWASTLSNISDRVKILKTISMAPTITMILIAGYIILFHRSLEYPAKMIRGTTKPLVLLVQSTLHLKNPH